MTSYLTSKTFWLAAGERAVRAFAVAMTAALLVPNATGPLGIDVLNVGWLDAASLAAGAAVLSLLGSVAAGPVGPPGSPSLVPDRPRFATGGVIAGPGQKGVDTLQVKLGPHEHPMTADEIKTLRQRGRAQQ